MRMDSVVMNWIDSIPLILGIAGVTIALLSALGLLVVRARIGEQIAELEHIEARMQRMQREIAVNAEMAARVCDRVESPFHELQLQQVKTEQTRVAERLERIAKEVEAFGRVLAAVYKSEQLHRRELKQVAEVARALQDRSARMSAVCSDAQRLFELEPVRELVEGLGSEKISAQENEVAKPNVASA